MIQHRRPLPPPGYKRCGWCHRDILSTLMIPVTLRVNPATGRSVRQFYLCDACSEKAAHEQEETDYHQIDHEGDDPQPT
jgi:uncharacterized protein with PIN domain